MQHRSGSAPPRRNRRWLRRLVLVLVLLLTPWIVYLGLGNLFLNAGGVALMLGGTSEVNVHYQRAWTWWFGRVHLRRLHFTFQDSNVEFALDIEQATVDLALLELPKRTFHATKLRGSGASFRMRHRLQPEAVKVPWVKALAPIPEFTDPPLFEASVPTPPIPEAQYRLWTIHLEDVDVFVSELWVQFVRYRGEARATGAFRLRPARHLWVGPAALALTRGRVTIGEDELVGDLRGRIGCVVHPFDVRVPAGLAVLRHISTQIELQGKRLQIDALPRWFSSDPEVEVKLAPAELAVKLDVRHGRGQSGSTVAIHSDSLRVSTPRADLATRGLSVASRVLEDGHIENDLHVAAGEISLSGQKMLTPATFRELTLGAHLANADTADPPSSADRHLEVRSIQVPDARWLNGVVKVPGFAFVSGKVSGHGAWAERKQRVTGNGTVELTHITARAGDVRLGTHGKLDFALSNVDTRALTGKARVNGALRELTVRSDAGGESSLESSVSRIAFHGEATRLGPGQLEAVLHAESALARGNAKQLWFRAQPKLDLSVEGERDRQKSTIALDLRDVAAGSSAQSNDCPWLKSPNTSVQLSKDSDSLSLAARVNALHFGWGDFHVQGNTEAKALLTFPRDETRSGGLTFSLQNRNVHLRSGREQADGWEATLPLVTWNGELGMSPKHAGYAELAETRLSGRIGGAHVATHLSAHVQVAELDVDHKHSRFAANVRVGPAELNAGGQRVNDWWARVTLGSGLVTAGTNLDLSALFQAELRDATPGLALLAERGAVPSIIASNLPLKQLSVTGIVQRRCRLTDFLITRASGGPLSVRGRLHSTNDSTRAALLLRVNGLEAISAGLSIDPEGTDVAPLAGDDWLREHKERLDEKAREILESPCPEPPNQCVESR